QQILCDSALSSLLATFTSRHLSSPKSPSLTLRHDIIELLQTLPNDISHIKPIVDCILTHSSDVQIWNSVYQAVAKLSRPHTPTASESKPDAVFATPVRESSAAAKHTTGLPKSYNEVNIDVYQNLDTIWYDVDLYNVFSESAAVTSEANQVFENFTSGQEPLYIEGQGWRNWPTNAKEESVSTWLQEMASRITQLSQTLPSAPLIRQKLISSPRKSLDGTENRYSPDVVIVDAALNNDDINHWNQILALIELKNEARLDGISTRVQLARYALQMFKAQHHRRFILGLTLCGSKMRLWSLDHSGMLGSTQIDINTDGEKFVSIVLGFLTMDRVLLGLDPTITSKDGCPSFNATIDGQSQCIILDSIISRQYGIMCRSTTCWRGHYNVDGESITVVVKDSWQAPERQEEELLQRAQERNIANMPRLLCAYTVQVNNTDDDIMGNIRKNTSVQHDKWHKVPNPLCSVNSSDSQKSTTSKKRTASEVGATESSSKRLARNAKAIKSNKKPHSSPLLPMNRVHKRAVFRDVGSPIYKEESLSILLESFAQCIKAHKSLLDAGILHRDISIGNLLINQDRSDPSRLGLLIDLDHAVDINRTSPSGLAVRTGTFLFMSIDILSGHKGFQHSFMDDLESFFWVLFWVCLDPKSSLVSELEQNTRLPTGLATYKQGVIVLNSFEGKLRDNCALKYKPLIPCVIELWRVVFPKGLTWETKNVNHDMYQKMMDILKKHAARIQKEDKLVEQDNKGKGQAQEGEEK
ncbi:hypothetical protein TD95_005428, partial [Thielaviopsis punctulata]